MRIKMLLPIVLLIALIAAVVVLRSPVKPLVGGVRDIEELWAIEDTREESETPLVTALSNFGVPLAYVEEENTFYCTLGMNNGDAWPELHLTAPGAQGVNICFSDDYTYDWCSDAIAEGYSYEMMAYTDTHYQYFYIVFTGLPMVLIDGPSDIGLMDEFCGITLSSVDGTASVNAMVHQRGAGSAVVSDKKSYRVDFVRDRNSGGVYVDLPILGEADDFILMALVTDDTKMRDKLSWEMYTHIADSTQSFGTRQCEYVEVFLAGEYMGLYLMMEPVDPAEEIAKTSRSNVGSDTVYRTKAIQYVGEKPYLVNPSRDTSAYELHYPRALENEFAALQPYMELELEEDDGVFCQKALELIDLESMMTQYLFVQGGGMSDNVYNNMYIWANFTPDGLRYRFAPWDMDLTWGRFTDLETGEAFQGLFTFIPAQRLIDLDAGGITKAMVSDIWQKMRDGAFTEETVAALIEEYTHVLNGSGAFMRDAVRWGKENTYADGYGIVAFAAERFVRMDEMFLSDDGAENEN